MRTLLPALLLLVACGEAPPVAIEPPPPLSERVAWSPVTPAERVVVATLPAEITTLPGGSWRLGPTSAARVLAWHVRPGDAVKAGDPLADLSSPELSALGARATDLASSVAHARELVEGRRKAVDAGVSPVTDLAEAEAALDAAEAEAAAARDALAVHAGGGAVKGGRFVWRAPASGTVAEVLCGLDEVGPGDVCVTLVDPGAAALRVDVPERHLGVLADAVTATFHAADGSTSAFAEASRAPMVDPHTRSRRFLLVPEGPAPLVGSGGRADLIASAPAGTVLVPEAALTRVEGKLAVLVRDGDVGKPVFVTRIGRTDAAIAVTGLPADAVVASKGVFLLKSLATLGDGEGE